MKLPRPASRALGQTVDPEGIFTCSMLASRMALASSPESSSFCDTSLSPHGPSTLEVDPGVSSVDGRHRG